MTDSFFLCYFETTRKCNLNCRYCMSRIEGETAGPELETEECKSLVLDEITRISSNSAVAFSGGEHLLRPDAFELLRYAAGKGIYSFINTNGRILLETDAVDKALAATDGRVIFVLPLNSTDAELNRKSRDDDLSTVLKAANLCEQKGAEHFFIVTVSSENIQTLKKTMSYLKMHRVPVLRAPFVPRGGGGNFPHLLFDKEQMENYIHPALSANHLAYISFTPFFASPERMQEIWECLEVKIDGLGCHAGQAFAAVGAEGGIVPCVQLLDSGAVRGNVRRKPLSEVYFNDPVFKALRSRDSLKGKCGRCRYRKSCGGCRALAFYHSGDILEEDPTCFFEPVDEEETCPLEEKQTEQVRKFVDYIKYTEPWNTLFG